MRIRGRTKPPLPLLHNYAIRRGLGGTVQRQDRRTRRLELAPRVGGIVNRYNVTGGPGGAAGGGGTLDDAYDFGGAGAGRAIAADAGRVQITGDGLETARVVYPHAGVLTLDVAGAITVTGSFHTVDTFGGAASDLLVTINGGTDGAIVYLAPEDDARMIRVDHDAGNVSCIGGYDIQLDDVEDVVVCIYSAAAGRWFALRMDIPNLEMVLSTASLGNLAGEANTGRIRNLGLLNFTRGANLTIDGAGDIDLTNTYHLIQGAGGGADDLDNISITATELGGQVVILQRMAGVGIVTVKHNTDNIQCVGSADFDLDQDWSWFWAIYDSARGKWLAMPGFGAGGAGGVDVEEDGAPLGTAAILDFIEPDAALVAFAAGTATISTSIYALRSGRAGGQTIIGGTGAGGSLILQSTSHVVKGVIWASGSPFLASGGAIPGTLYIGLTPNRLLELGYSYTGLSGDMIRGVMGATASIGGGAWNGLYVEGFVTLNPGIVAGTIQGLFFAAGVAGGTGGAGVGTLSSIRTQLLINLTGTVGSLRGIHLQGPLSFLGVPVVTTTWGIHIENYGPYSFQVDVYGIQIQDTTLNTGFTRLLEVGPATPYFRVVGQFAAAVNQTAVYISEGAGPALRQLRTASYPTTIGSAKVFAYFAYGTYYVPPYGISGGAVITQNDMEIPAACQIDRLYAHADPNTLNGTLVLTLMKNGVATALTVTIAAGSVVTVSDLVNVVGFAAGDTISMRYVENASSGSANFTWSVRVRETSTDYPCVLV